MSKAAGAVSSTPTSLSSMQRRVIPSSEMASMGFGMSGGLMVGRVGPCILFGRRHWASLPKRGDEEDRVRKVDGIAWVNGLVG
jgi:hypothetical protein